VADDASEEQLEQCAAVCAGETSLLDALEELGLTPTDPGVYCYLALYDDPPARAGETVTSTNSSIGLTSQCGCLPTSGFVDCLAGEDAEGEVCFDEDGVYDRACGETCWNEFGSDCPP
jgi:hypothetical protein